MGGMCNVFRWSLDHWSLQVLVACASWRFQQHAERDGGWPHQVRHVCTERGLGVELVVCAPWRLLLDFRGFHFCAHEQVNLVSTLASEQDAGTALHGVSPRYLMLSWVVRTVIGLL